MNQRNNVLRSLIPAACLLALAVFLVFTSRGQKGPASPLQRPEISAPTSVTESRIDGPPLVAVEVPVDVPGTEPNAAEALKESGDRTAGKVAAAERFFVRVLDEHQQPAAGAVVYQDGTSRESVRQIARTGSDGRAALAREYFPARGQSLFAIIPGGKSTLSSFSDGSNPWPGPIELKVPAPPKEPGCFGRVLSARDGTPIQGASLAMFPAPNLRADGGRSGIFGGRLEPILTDSKGEFKLPYLAPHGSVEALVVSGAGYASSQIKWSEVAKAQEAQSSLDVSLRAPVQRRGSVRFEDGAPARGVTVGVRPTHAPFQWLVSTRTDQDGRFELATPPGEVKLEAFLHAYASVSEAVADEPEPIALELPYKSTTRVIIDAPADLDRRGLSLYVEDDFGLTEYALVEGEIPVYVMIESRARLMLAAAGSRLFESFVPVASAEEVMLKGEVTQTVEFSRPATGSLEVEVAAALLARLGEPTEVNLIDLAPGAAPYVHKVKMTGTKMRIDRVPARNLRLGVSFRDSFEIAMQTVDVNAGTVTTLMLDE